MEPIHPFRITDMIRATVSVYIDNNSKEGTISDLVKVYEKLNTRFPSINIIRIKNKLNTSNSNVTLNFICQNKIIGEIQLNYVYQPKGNYGGRFLYELSRADTVS